MRNVKAMMSSKMQNWMTPPWLFKKLDNEFHFDLDPCADEDNHLCANWYSETADGLKQNWGGHTVYCNPPYGRGITGQWVQKCFEESKKPGTTVVLLVPARTSAGWFHDYILNKAEIRFINGRLRFSGHNENAPFDSVIAVYGDGRITGIRTVNNAERLIIEPRRKI